VFGLEGLDGQGGDAVLRPGSTLFVYLAFASTIPAGYAGMLDIPVLGGHTGGHAHVFISRTYAGIYRRVPVAVQSGVYPVFVHEGLHAALQAGGTGGTLQPKESSSGAHLRLSLAALGIPKGNWALPPPKEPKYSVFQSANPLVFARDDVAALAPQLQDGGLLPYMEPVEMLASGPAQMLDGELEQKLQSIWPAQEESSALAINPVQLLDGEITQMLYSTWPAQQESSTLAINPVQWQDGSMEEMIYSDLPLAEEMQLAIFAPDILDGTLETS